MTTSVIQKLFEVPVNQSNIVFELNELSQSEGFNETVLKTFTTAEAFAALITKVNPVISGTASVANMSLNLSEAREQLATSKTLRVRPPISLSPREPQKKQTQSLLKTTSHH